MGANIVKHVYELVIHDLACKIRESHTVACTTFDVSTMDAVGPGKVRFVGGWAISRVLVELKRKIASGIWLTSNTVICKKRSSMNEIKFLKTYLIVPNSVLCKSTSYAETLAVTE